MAESNLTKRALASALKELMAEVPFEKINVTQICKKCGIQRKSFYYHFRDKYDLVNWIYDTEFVAVIGQQPQASSWELLLALLNYLYTHQDFYRRALMIQGQNAFSDHFRQRLMPLVEQRLRQTMTCQEVQEFHINFFADAIICAILRWLLGRDCVAPEDFLALLKSCIEQTAVKVYHDIRVQ